MRRKYCLVLFCLFCVCSLFSNVAAAKEVHEDQVKAVFLYNLTHFVHWPQNDSSSSFDVGIVGTKSFSTMFKLIINEESKDGRPIKVETDLDFSGQDWSVLYLDGELIKQWETIRKEVEGKPILTVSDYEDFARMGGMVALVRHNNNIRFEVNYNQVQRADLKMSAKLLKLAEIVE